MIRSCIAHDDINQCKICNGCFGSAAMDRSDQFYEFETNVIDKNSLRFLNADCWTKDSLASIEPNFFIKH